MPPAAEGPRSQRPHRLVVYGASGFTGGLVAEYLARAGALADCALAGRSRRALEEVRARLGAIDPAGAAGLTLLHAEAGDPASLAAVARSTRVLISTVGPYLRYGEGAVAACAAAGTDYVDLTGEPEFVDRMWLAYHEQAVRTGARLVHSCGFDSIPHDLGVLWTVSQLPEGVPIRIEGFARARGTLSGGTIATTIEVLGRLRQAAAAARERRAEGAVASDGRRVRGASGRPRNVSEAGGWSVPMPGIDPITVLRSARALARYGPDFSYSHYLVVGGLPALAGLVLGFGAATALAQLPPGRALLRRLAPSPGTGPSAERRARSWFSVRFVARAGGMRLVTEVAGGDPGYGETAKMLAESALCLACDELPERAGQLTPAAAMGEPLIARLQRAGIRFTVRS